MIQMCFSAVSCNFRTDVEMFRDALGHTSPVKSPSHTKMEYRQSQYLGIDIQSIKMLNIDADVEYCSEVTPEADGADGASWTSSQTLHSKTFVAYFLKGPHHTQTWSCVLFRSHTFNAQTCRFKHSVPPCDVIMW
ncbi:hypothetical protein NQD34_002972 [Periophthalmus magnuspinnatus]|nr:hypothetical protein NQD34_002972 [Periophthalmus magnuspinnatus]